VEGYHQGITVTCPGFYGPQGKILRLGISNPHLIDRLSDFQFGHHFISNFEMETSAIYGLGHALGHHCLSLSAIIANRIHKNFSSDSQALINKLITTSLDIMVNKL
jgi:uridine phosphorylase